MPHTSMNFTPENNNFIMEFDGYIVVENSIRMYYNFYGTIQNTGKFMKLYSVKKVG